MNLMYEIKEHHKKVDCVAWAPNGNWIASASNKDHNIRIWDVSLHDDKKRESTRLTNNMVSILKKHTLRISKVQFHTDTILVSASEERSIIIWELIKVARSAQTQYKARVVRKIANGMKFYQEILLTKQRFICRKSNPAEIKIVKFTDLKRDLTEEVLKEDFYK